MVRIRGRRGLVIRDFVASGANAAAGAVPKPPAQAGSTKFLREDGTWSVPSNTPGAHAASHKHAGSDEVAVAAAAANAIPKAGSGGTLAAGWIPPGVATVNGGSVTRAAATATGTQDVAHGLGVAPKMILFVGKDDAAAVVYSNGWARGTAQSAFTGNNTLGGRSGFATCIDIVNGTGDGHDASVTVVDATNFRLSWTKRGAGRDVTVKWMALS
jgi:hypothetical protein